MGLGVGSSVFRICYTTYQRPRLFNFPSRVRNYSCDSQIVPNHCRRSYPRYSLKRNWLSGNLFRLSFFPFLYLCWILVFKEHETEYDDKRIFSSLWRFLLLFWFYFIPFFPIALVGVVVGLSTNIVSYFILENVLNEFPFRSRTCSSSWSWRLSTFCNSRFSDQCKQGRDYDHIPSG